MAEYFHSYLSLYETLEQSPRNVWEKIFAGNRTDILNNLRTEIWCHVKELDLVTKKYVFQRKTSDASVETFFGSVLDLKIEDSEGLVWFFLYPPGESSTSRDYSVMLDRTKSRIQLKLRSVQTHEMNITGCLFLKATSQWTYHPFTFRILPYVSDVDRAIKRLISLPYMEEYIKYGQPVNVPSVFYLSNSKLRNTVFSSLFRSLNEHVNPAVVRMGSALHTEWKAQRDAFRANYVCDVPAKFHRSTRLWQLTLPRERCPSTLQIGDRISVRCSTNEVWVYVGFIHNMFIDDSSSADNLQVMVSFPLDISTLTRTFPILRFHLDASSFYHMTLAVCKSDSISDWLFDKPETKVTLLPRDDTMRGMVEQTVKYLLDPYPRILVITPTETMADQFTLNLMHELCCYVLSRPLKEMIFRLHEWNRDKNEVSPELMDVSCLDFKRRFSVPPRTPFRVWVTTARASRVLDRIPFTQPFTHVLINDASRMTEPETLIPLTVASTQHALQIVLTGDLTDTPSQSLYERLYQRDQARCADVIAKNEEEAYERSLLPEGILSSW